MSRGRIIHVLLWRAVIAVHGEANPPLDMQGLGVSHEGLARRRRRSSLPIGGQTSSHTEFIGNGWIHKMHRHAVPHFHKIHHHVKKWKAQIAKMKTASSKGAPTPALRPPNTPTRNKAKAPSGKLLRSRYTPMDYHRSMCVADIGDGYLTMKNCSFDDASQLWTVGPGKALQNTKTSKCMTTAAKKHCGT
eukprot:gnl/MRDRNA2_/MRDRNA2_35994_c0_seq2.p1 gnl/MRDRNA2_/MRDRNA2_35994_c0~~gnl/MRDRNA2_/MRDRNA2_35994_c0_seq2.p1  ORF type:complete len:190 (+),score=17.40 gnl/MRDRNA2_/MRDRNA2_35994_c0_seq2:107-676(+)